LDNKEALSTGNVSDTTLVMSDVVVKENFTKETWCNGGLQAWQKAIVPFETQGIHPENRAHTVQHLHGKHSFYYVCPGRIGTYSDNGLIFNYKYQACV